MRITKQTFDAARLIEELQNTLEQEQIDWTAADDEADIHHADSIVVSKKRTGNKLKSVKIVQLTIVCDQAYTLTIIPAPNCDQKCLDLVSQLLTNF